MTVERNGNQLDVIKVFEAIAQILSRRGEGNVRLVGVREASGDSRKAG